LVEVDYSGAQPVAVREPVEYAPAAEYSPEPVAADCSNDLLQLAVPLVLVPARLVEPADWLPADCLRAADCWCWRWVAPEEQP
jgi:hypothetical protein